jgi:hypothetical protein
VKQKGEELTNPLAEGECVSLVAFSQAATAVLSRREPPLSFSHQSEQGPSTGKTVGCET